MEKSERNLVEKILGRDFLNAAETYGKNMRTACALQGASKLIQESMERIATVAFCKGASYFVEGMWHKLDKGYPPLNTWLCVRNDDDALAVRKVVKHKDGFAFVDEKGTMYPKPKYWMLPPELKTDQESKTIPIKK